MKVLHVNDYPLDAGGGAEVVMRQTIDLLRSAGHVVENFTVADLTRTRLTLLRYLDNRHARRALARKLAAFRPAVVHLHNWYHRLSPGILATLDEYKQERPLRVVMTAHDYHLVCPNSGGSVFSFGSSRRQAVDAGRLDSLAYLLTHSWDHRSCVHSLLKLTQHLWHYRWHHRQHTIDHILCPSRFVQGMLATTGVPTSWLPHPLPPSARRGSPDPAALPRPNALHLLFVGRVEPEKGLAEFLQALPDDLDARLTVIGDGADMARCQAIAARRSWENRIAFLGRLPHDQTLARVASAHVLVQPSRVLETYGLTLIEALVAGTNVLASDRGALREIVADSGVGFLYNIEEPATLAQQLHAIRRQHADGTLNRFNIAAFLEERSAAHHLTELLKLYDNDAAVSLNGRVDPKAA